MSCDVTRAGGGGHSPGLDDGRHRPAAYAALPRASGGPRLRERLGVEQVLARFRASARGAPPWAAALTSRIRLGTASCSRRSGARCISPGESLATLDQLSGGRLDVGIAGEPEVYPAFGISAERRVARFNEGLRLMQALWTEPRVTFAGEFWQLEARRLSRSRSSARTRRSGSARTIRTRSAGRSPGRGLHGRGIGDDRHLREGGRPPETLLAEAGRDPASIEIGKRVYVGVDADRDRAGRRLAEYFAGFYGRSQLAAEVSVWGSVDEVVAGLRDVIAAGAGLVTIQPGLSTRSKQLRAPRRRGRPPALT